MGAGLSTEALLDTARSRTGLEDFGEASFVLGLDRVVDGLEHEARLSELGVAIAPEILLGYLTNRLQIIDWHHRHPEMGRAEIRAPIVMIGMGRTGTTILHDLLGQDPANRIPRTWEVDRPCPPPETATYDTDPRIAEVEATIDAANQAHPEFKAMHPLGARLGQECIRMTGGEFASLIFLSQYRLPSYLQWLTTEADMAPAYRWHRRYLQLLQWRHGGERWVLKSGAHLWALPALIAEYPDARFIQTHRDPMRVVPSLSSLFATVRRTSSDDVSVAGVAGEWAAPMIDALDRSVSARETGLIPKHRVVDLQYEEFLADPIETIRTIYARWDLELRPEIETGMRTYLAANAQDKHGTHRYSLADTGLDERSLFEQTRRYREYFAVPAETPR
jgi:sulfotransferase family protein